MRIKFQKIPMVHDRSFAYFNVVHDRFNGPLHYHPEIEITKLPMGMAIGSLVDIKKHLKLAISC